MSVESPPAFTCPSLSTTLFETNPDCAKLLDLDGRLLEMNRNGQTAMEVEDFTGVRGHQWVSFWPEAAQPQVAASVDAAREGRTTRFQAFCPTAKGVSKWWDVTVAPVMDAQGRPELILSISRDITDLLRVREEQQETASHLRFILESACIGDWELDPATGQAWTSPLHDRCFGYETPVEGWSYARFMEHVHPEDRAHVEASFAQAKASRQDWRFECRVLWADGSEHWIAAHGGFYGGAGATAARLLGTVIDITERKHAEAALQEAHRVALQAAEEAETERLRLDALLQAAPVAIVYTGPDGQLLSANAATRRLWGEYPSPRHVNEYREWKGWWADGSERHGEALQAHDWPIARLLDGRATRVLRDVVEIEPFDAPGTRKTTLLQAELLRDKRGRVTGGVLVQMDITEQVKAEAALRESETRFRTITNAVPQMIWSTRPDGSSDYFSRQWYEFTGTEEGTSDGFGWVELVHPDDRAAADAAWRHSAGTGTPYEVEYRLQHHSGDYRWVLARGVPVLDADGAIERWMGTCTDVHERKMFESALERSEDALRTADRRKDEFLAMLAHELRNPLAPISTAAQLLHRAPDDARRVRQASEIIDRQVRHMTELVDDLLDVSRVTRGLVELDREPLDLREVVAAAIEQARPLIEARGHTLRTRAGLAPVAVEGDRTRLVQVVVNLLNNAAKYTPQGGGIELALETVADAARIIVRDTGVGIDPALLPGIFELFTQGERTPDRSQGGLGIGLALVRSIAQLHGGRVEAHSAGANAGSTFVIELPIIVAVSGAAEPAPQGHDGPRRPLRVLAVDDNQDAGEMLGELLRMEGHEVVVATDARSALAHVEQDPELDVFVLDIGLPEMTGYELATRIRERIGTRPARFVALTGYGQPQDRVLSKAAGFDDHLVKPVDAARLLALLARCPASGSAGVAAAG